MLKQAVAVLAIALAGTAGAAGWKSLRVDGSSEESFAKSVAVFNEKLSPARRYVFGQALMDIWLAGTKDAAANQGQYTAADYYRQLDGLSYGEVVTFTDPTGDTAERRYREASLSGRGAADGAAAASPWQKQGKTPADRVNPQDTSWGAPGGAPTETTTRCGGGSYCPR
jgi:hypothetical protein